LANRSAATARTATSRPAPKAPAKTASTSAALRVAGLDIPGVPPVGARPLQMALAAHLSQTGAVESWSPRRTLAVAVAASGGLWGMIALGAVLLRG
jgi:hypothetical protein